MKTKLFFIGLLVASISIQAQMVSVALHKATGTEIFTGVDPFKAAYAASVAGDTIYLSGGSFVAPANFDKQLFIYGVGHYPDSTAATNPTTITGDFILTENADNFYLEGVNLKNQFYTDTNASVNAFTIRRVKIDGSTTIQGTAVNSTNITFIECILNHVNLNNATNSAIFNSILYNYVNYSNANVFKNNIFLYYGSANLFSNSNNNEISNNVIIQTYGNYISNGNGNTYKNNLFVSAAPNYGTSPILINNYLGVAQADIFVNQTGYAFDYTHDYHLQVPETYLGADNPATQVGIYGGNFPFKTANMPITPHISTQNISSSTDNNGMLNINIKVNAQKN
ncbi:hypothetical protein [Lutibacter sp.]|uniref:hypothetical protein n=1 Tax=Lutibacter sp. TaxID=1925666 RepID=UPI0035612B9C